MLGGTRGRRLPPSSFTRRGDDEGGQGNVGGKKKSEEKEPKPIGKGPFGDIYDQFKGKAKEAIDFLLSHKSGDLLGVFHRDEIGDIDLVWGNDKGGLCHIIEKHVGYGENGVKKDFGDINELAEKMEDVFAKGKVTKRAGDRCRITHDGFTIIVSQNVNGERKNWVITAVDYNRSEKEKGITANPPLASHGAEGEQSSHVTPRNPERKSTEKGNTAQEKGGKNEGEKTNSSSNSTPAVSQVNIGSLVGALRKNGEAKLSDHTEPLTQGEKGQAGRRLRQQRKRTTNRQPGRKRGRERRRTRACWDSSPTPAWRSSRSVSGKSSTGRRTWASTLRYSR
ncbi:MAG: hypothetical protein LUC86_08140 [Prevotellaceae bacterium]|nr:hypothetical protein [Prevotellaceae bacterium]